MDAWHYNFDPQKNDLLIRERGISFEYIIFLIQEGKLLQVLEHPNQDKYPGQYIFEVDVSGYVYVVPVVINKNEIFLKTIYPSRKATKNKVRETET
jgi:hypothetical protein